MRSTLYRLQTQVINIDKTQKANMHELFNMDFIEVKRIFENNLIDHFWIACR